MDADELIAKAAGLNAGYRSLPGALADETGYGLALGFLYGTATLIVAQLDIPADLWMDMIEGTAAEIDQHASTRGVPKLLPWRRSS